MRRLAAADDLPSLTAFAGFAGALEAVGVPGFAVVRGSFGMESSLVAGLDAPGSRGCRPGGCLRPAARGGAGPRSYRWEPPSGRAGGCGLGQLGAQRAFDRRQALAAGAVGARPGEVGADSLADAAGAPLQIELHQLELVEHGEEARAARRGPRVAAGAGEGGLDGVGTGVVGQRAQGAECVRERRPQVELGSVDEQGELRLGGTPGEVGAGAGAQQAVGAAAGRRVERDQMVGGANELRIGCDGRPGRDRHPARRQTGHDLLQPLPPPRHVRDSDEHGRAAREEIAGDAGEALAAAIERLAREAPGHRLRAAAGASSARSTRSQKEPSSPSTCSSPGVVGHSARRITRGSTIPFQRFRSSRSAMSWLPAEAASSVFGAEPNATPRERAPPAVTRVKRACSPSSPMPVTC